MAEWFVGPVMEKIIDTCFEHLKDHLGRKTSVEEQLKKLRVIHPRIQAVVSAYSQAQIEDPALNEWYWQLRDAVDEADDVLDELEYNRKREKQASTSSRKRKADLLERALEIGKSAVKGDPNLKRLEEAVQKLYEISTEVSTFQNLLDRANQEQQKQQLKENRETGSLIKNGLLGRREEMEFVWEWLRNSYQTQVTDSTDLYRNISLLSIVGHGGMGKTTLLQHVYNDIDITSSSNEFDVKIWICVSTNFDTKTVIANILKSLKKQVSNEDSLETLQTSLQSEVNSKRFFLVLDDIWEKDEEDQVKWENVIAPLRNGSFGSMILITTRLDSVASMFGKMLKNNRKRRIEGLEEGNCLELFNRHAFADVKNPDEELKSIAVKIVEKLFGCPLAAKVIGGILNLDVDKSYWTKVLNTNIGKVTNLRNVRPGHNYFLSILKLSCIYLPHYVQNCFAFCCMFEQDHEFDKDDLVRMWIALGFVQSSNIQGETLEETGRRYFTILVQKSFFEEFCTYDGKVCYKMHDLLHELALSVSSQECFKVLGDKEFSIPPKTIRHLSIDTGLSDLEATIQKIGKFKSLRSLFLCLSGNKLDGVSENVILEIFKASKSIRLVVISTLDMDPEKIYEMMSYLIHLRYLKVEDFNNCLSFQRSISHLYHLQFIISKKLKILEIDVIGLKELLPNVNCQLMVDELVIKDPSALLMETLRSICSFSILSIEENDELVSFPSETEQWFLQHSSSFFGLKFVELQSLESLPSSVESLSSLQSLSINDVPQLKLLPNLPASLRTLELVYLESLQCLPSSLPAISSLECLDIINIPLLRSLPGLPSSLKRFGLVNLESLQCLPSSLPAISSLECLVIKNIPLRLLPGLPSSLEVFGLANLESFQCLPSSLSTFSSLTYLILMNIPLLKSLPDLPSSLEKLELIDLKSLQCLPSSLSTLSSLSSVILSNIPLLKSLPDLPPSLTRPQLIALVNLESLQWQPSCLPTALHTLYIINVPRLLQLPDLPSSLENLHIQDCHPQLMERYPNHQFDKYRFSMELGVIAYILGTDPK